MTAAKALPHVCPPTPAVIRRPDEPRHSMRLEPVAGLVTARVGDTLIATSNRALKVTESFGDRTYEPVIYFPPQDVQADLLAPVEGTTECPLKGTAAYFDIEGPRHVDRGAWSYQRTQDFDRRLTQLECCVAFDRTHVDIDISQEQ